MPTRDEHRDVQRRQLARAPLPHPAVERVQRGERDDDPRTMRPTPWKAPATSAVDLKRLVECVDGEEHEQARP